MLTLAEKFVDVSTTWSRYLTYTRTKTHRSDPRMAVLDLTRKAFRNMTYCTFNRFLNLKKNGFILERLKNRSIPPYWLSRVAWNDNNSQSPIFFCFFCDIPDVGWKRQKATKLCSVEFENSNFQSNAHVQPIKFSHVWLSSFIPLSLETFCSFRRRTWHRTAHGLPCFISWTFGYKLHSRGKTFALEIIRFSFFITSPRQHSLRGDEVVFEIMALTIFLTQT